MIDTIDVVVISYGGGHRDDPVSLYYCGVYDSDNDYIVGLGCFRSDNLLLGMEYIAFTSRKPLYLFGEFNQKTDFIKDIIVVEIEINKIEQYDGRFYLDIDFAEFVRVRHDKNWNQATTLEEIKSLYALQK